jgi:hypothetical protein
MPERPRPDMDHTREALRQHDERVAEDEEEAEREEGSGSGSGSDSASDDDEGS